MLTVAHCKLEMGSCAWEGQQDFGLCSAVKMSARLDFDYEEYEADLVNAFHICCSALTPHLRAANPEASTNCAYVHVSCCFSAHLSFSKHHRSFAGQPAVARCCDLPGMMADPVTIIGLVSSIITFVEFGFKVAGGAKQILESGDGTTQELAELDSIIENIRRSNSEVQAQISVCNKSSSDEKNVLKMVNQCEALTSELRKLITKLTARNSSIIEVGRVAWTATWKKNDIGRLKSRLIALQEQIKATVQDAFQE